MNKRGVSVLISSILLILIVISLFSVVAYFLRKGSGKVIQEGSESFEKMINCDEINFQVEDVCYDKQHEYPKIPPEYGIYFGIKVKNNNNFKLENFRVKLSSGETVTSSETAIITPDILYIEPYGVGTIYGGTPEWGTDTEREWIKLYPMVNGETCDSKEYKINLKGVKKCPL